jgi:hypothetical protein
VDLRAGLDDLEKRKYVTLPGLELRPLSRPVRKLVAIPTTLSWLQVRHHMSEVSPLSVLSVKYRKQRLVDADRFSSYHVIIGATVHLAVANSTHLYNILYLRR